jgi:hypothetical protein
MPSSHRRYANWTPELRRQADAIGRNTSALVEIILRERAHPEQGFRACVGIVRLAKTWGRERLGAACCRALEIGARSYSSVNSILKKNLRRRRPAMPADGPAIAHDNIRRPTYFHRGDDERCSLSYLDHLRALKLDGMAQAFVELEAKRPGAIWPMPNGWPCCSTARRPIATPAASKPGCAPPGCVTVNFRSLSLFRIGRL